METTNFKFHRLDLSPYQSPEFCAMELEVLSKLKVGPAKDIEDADILISNTHTDFNLLSSFNLSKTKLLIHPNSGYDNIPVDFVLRANFPIITGNPIRANAVTEYTIASVFKHFSSINHQRKWEPGRAWPRKRLADQNLLIIGKGFIGSLLNEALSPLVKTISCYDPFKDLNFLEPKGKDIVLIAASLNPTSTRLIDIEFLKNLNPGWLLVNGARGKIVNQEDLKKALMKDAGAFAYIDVFEKEPFEEIDFNEVKNIQCTSHIAGVSANLDQLILDFESKIISDFITQCLNNINFSKKYSSLALNRKLSPDKSFLI